MCPVNNPADVSGFVMTFYQFALDGLLFSRLNLCRGWFDAALFPRLAFALTFASLLSLLGRGFMLEGIHTVLAFLSVPGYAGQLHILRCRAAAIGRHRTPWCDRCICINCRYGCGVGLFCRCGRRPECFGPAIIIADKILALAGK